MKINMNDVIGWLVGLFAGTFGIIFIFWPVLQECQRWFDTRCEKRHGKNNPDNDPGEASSDNQASCGCHKLIKPYSTYKPVCTLCGKRLDMWDVQENFELDYHVGYGSKYDGDHIYAQFCGDCFDKAIDYIIENGHVDPIMPDSESYQTNRGEIIDEEQKQAYSGQGQDGPPEQP